LSNGVAVGQSPAGKDVSTEAEEIVGIRYQTTASKEIEDFACAIVILKVCRLVRVLLLSVVMSYKSSVNSISIPNPVSSY
jgi:hypothetical protein